MAFEIELGSPQATTLQNIVQAKLMELGWTTDNLEDTSLAEYIVLMLGSDKTKDELVAEVAEFIGVDSQDSAVNDFGTWLIAQTEQIFGAAQTGQAAQAQTSQQNVQSSAAGGSAAEDTEMGDDKSGHDPTIPTGPKSMRNDSRSRGRHMVDRLNRAMDRSNDGVLHRIRGAAGRVNTHSNNNPRGQTPRGPRGAMHRSAGGRNNSSPSMNQMNQGNMFGPMSPQQQMQLFAMYEEQAKMMAQILSPQQQQQILSAQMAQANQQQQQQPGKSLFERIDGGQGGGSPNQNPQHAGNTFSNNQNELTSSMEVESSPQDDNKPDPSTTLCRFNVTCTKPDCHFAHQSPAAPPGTIVDTNDECTFGAACKNRKCTGRHPSPAKLGPQRAEQDCKFFPHCTNPSCPFRHPSMPPCRNGADCSVPGCKFSHSKVPCKYDPCLNPSCPYKHVEGQQRGTYADKVWVSREAAAEENQEQTAHLSNRKFIDENAGEEELIRPGQEEQTTATAPATTTATASDPIVT